MFMELELESDMSVRDYLLEKIEMYCDADRRRKADAEELRKHCPTVGEAMQWAVPRMNEEDDADEEPEEGVIYYDKDTMQIED